MAPYLFRVATWLASPGSHARSGQERSAPGKQAVPARVSASVGHAQVTLRLIAMIW
jgi:hypothetical protein